MIEIDIEKGQSFKGYTLIEGFPGIGLVGPMAISYIIDKLQMENVGYLHSKDFPPLVSIHKGQAMHPIRIYCSDKDKIVTIFAEFAITLDMVSELSDVIYKFVKDNGIKAIYSIGGMPQQGTDKKPFAISTGGMTKSLQNAGFKPIMEGVATGVSALLLIKSTNDNVDDTSIMVPVEQNIIDPAYAEIAIDGLNKLLNLKIDVEELDKEAKAVEAKIKDLINKHKETNESYKKAIDSTGPSMYA